eukprot:jgi/Tetstr1/461271/TSEL_006398.t1
MSSLRIAVLKRDFLSAGLPTFSGGKHAFRCLARSLAAAGLRVTVLCEATPAQVMLSFVEEVRADAHGTCDTARRVTRTPLTRRCQCRRAVLRGESP